MNTMVVQEYRTANKKATPQTVKLYTKLFRILPQGILFGHQDDLELDATYNLDIS